MVKQRIKAIITLSPIKIIFLLGCLFSLSLNFEVIKFSDGYQNTYTASDLESLKIVISPGDITNYMHVVVTSESTTNQIVYFSNVDEKCMKGRQLMSMKPSGDIDLFLNNNQVTSTKDNYVCVQCQNSKTCKFTVKLTKEDACTLPLGKQYSYYVYSEETQTMTFSFTKDTNFVNKRNLVQEPDSLVSIWAKGNSPLLESKLNVSSAKKKSFVYGDMYSFEKNKEQSDTYELDVFAEVGDYITVGSKVVSKGIVSTNVVINEPEIMGYLIKGTHEEECFYLYPMEDFKYEVNEVVYINGLIYDRIGRFYYKTQKGDIYGEKQVTNSNIVDVLYGQSLGPQKKFCVSFSNDEEKYGIKELVFSIQLTDHTHIKYNQYIYSPQLLGLIYPHYLVKGEIAIFAGMKPKNGTTEIVYNMKSVEGFPDMLFDVCTTFPNCFYDENKLNNIKNPRHVNRMTTYTYVQDNEQEITPISPYQPLLVVNCTDGTKKKASGEGKDDRESTTLCYFETSIASEKDTVILHEGDSFAQYILAGENDKYIIEYGGEKKVTKVYLDLIIFSGDVEFEIAFEEENIHKYFLANKVFYSITLDNSAIKEVDFGVTAYRNSFYMVQAQLVREGDESLRTNLVESGVNYLESVEMTSDSHNKILKIDNLKTAYGYPFLTNFYSLNCDFIVTKKNTQTGEDEYLKMYNGYGQDIITTDDSNYYNGRYEYTINAVEDDASKYDRKLCMVYVSGIELESTVTGMEREISISEGVPQQFAFEKGYTRIKYAYHISDLEDSLVINFNLIDKTTYKIIIYYGYTKSENTYVINRNRQLILKSEEIEDNCEKNEVCTIAIDITYVPDSSKPDLEPRLETTVQQMRGAPVYLPKNILKSDVLIGNFTKYYYVDIGKNDAGYVSVNYRRGGGKLYGKIVQKNQVSRDDDANWRDTYKFPDNMYESLRYESYLKKLSFNPEDTTNCDKGCYLLISLTSSIVLDAIDAYTPSLFSIIVYAAPVDVSENEIPKINIKINEYIVGNVGKSTNEQIKVFYDVWIPYDADYVIFDWQSDRPSLYVNVGNERPTKDNADFIFEAVGHDTLFKLSKRQILEDSKIGRKLPVKLDSIKDMHLVLGIWSNFTDTYYTSVYSLKVHLANDDFDIYHVRSDQKVLCEPQPINDGSGLNRCLYAVVFDKVDIMSHITAYPKSQKESTKIQIYASLVDSEYVEKNDVQFLKANIPTRTKSEFNSDITGNPYIYLPAGEPGKSLYISVVTDTDSIVELLSSANENEIEVTPNPSTAQLFSLRDKTIKLNFQTSQDLLINIVSVNGQGELYWEKEEGTFFYLRGKDDRLTLTSGTSNLETALSNLVIRSTSEIQEIDDPGFMFYITYYPRSVSYNYDQLKVGKTVEFNYRESDFPINFFVPLYDTSKDISITLNFMDLSDSEFRERFFSEKQILNIWASIIPEKEAFLAKYSKANKPKKTSNSISGTFNSALNVASVFLSKNDINNFRVKKEDKPTLFFSVEKGEDTKFVYTRISAEITVLQEGNNIPATEKVYQYGKLSNNDYSSSSHNEYILNINKNKPYMRVQFASNSGLLNWSVNRLKGSRNNDTFVKKRSEYSNGRSILTFLVPDIDNTKELYLNVFSKDKNTKIRPELGNYVFKYMNGPKIDAFSDYKISDRKMVLTSAKNADETSNYNVVMDAVPGSEKYKVSYFLKVVSEDNYIENESVDTIAITESVSSTLQIDNPSVDSDGKVSMMAYSVKKTPKYIIVLAKIKEGSINEFITYEPYISNQQPFVPTTDLVEIDYDSSSVSKDIESSGKRTHFLLKFPSNVPEYVQVQTTSRTLPNQILYFSPTDPEGMKNREQLAQEGAGKVVTMWIKKAQFSSKKFYVTVECKNEQKCNFNIKFTGLNYIVQESKFIYNYYVSANNKEMLFHINRQSSYDKYKYVTFYAKGSTNAQISVNNLSSVKSSNFRFGTAMTFQIPSSYTLDYFDLVVTAKEGDYLSVGGKVNYEVEGNVLQPNSAEVTGFLIKGKYEDECNAVDLTSVEFSEIKSIYIAGVFYNRIAEVYLRNYEYEEIVNSGDIVESGSYYYSYDFNDDTNRIIHVCVRFPQNNKYTVNEIPYSIQVIDADHKVGLSNIFSPQGNGIIYPRLLTKGSLVFYSGVTSTDNTDEVSYNMLTVYGFPKMYVHKCTTFPVCEYDDSNLDTLDLIKPNEINRMTTWLTEEKNKSPIAPEQYVMIVKCQNIESSPVCIYHTSIFGNHDQVTLLENESFSQYILKGEEDNFVIDFNYEEGLQKLYLDALVMSGDVTFNIRKEDGKAIDYHKYYLANKIFYSINLSNNKGLTKVYIDIKASMNSFYSIEYKLVRQDQDQLTNNIFTGVNYLVPIDPSTESRGKVITISNLNVEDRNIFLTNFYSLNCRFSIEREIIDGATTTHIPIKSYNNYAQEVLSQDSADYYSIDYSYNITITEEDPSVYDHKMCMLYVSGLELSSEGAKTQREIVISENVPQRVIFEKGFNKVRYLYPHSDPNVDIVVDFKVIDIAKYSIKIIYNYEDVETIETSASQLIYIPRAKIINKCYDRELCSVIVEIKLEQNINGDSPMIETSIRQTLSVPTYFPKGVARQDFVVNNKFLYLYTDVGKNERGFITVNFLRGSGKIYGKIVEKNQATVDDGATWRQYRYPSTFAESLKYDGYSKKMTFTADDTQNCEKGCYLLLGIQSSVSGKYDEDYRFYPVTIISSITPSIRIYTDIPKIALRVDEYAVGSIITLDTSERLYEFYEIYLPYDADVVQFDWQSDVAGLFVGVGDERPTKENAPFKLGSKSKDTIMEISKKDILDWAKRNDIPIPVENSLKNLNLVIGISAEVIDSISYTIYTLKVHLPIKKNDKQLNIYKVDSDQTTLCQPTKNSNNEYECLYMVLYTDFNLINDFMAYAESQDKNATVYMYADFIDKDIYDTFDIEKLNVLKPSSSSAKYNNKKDKVNYIYLRTGKLDSHLFINAVSDTPGVVEFVSSFYTYDKVITPNPSTVQLFSVSEDSVTFSFSTSKDLLINIISLNGEGEIYWENEPDAKYHIRGRDDRLALTSFTHKQENKGLNLIIKNKNGLKLSSNKLGDERTMDDPGFAFHISYFRRTTAFNFDEIVSGKTFEFAYRDTNFPLYYYSRTYDLESDLNIFINFHEMVKQESKNERVYKNSYIRIIGSVIKEKTVYGMRTNPDLSPEISLVNLGIYDPALKIGHIYISQKDIKNYKITLADKPTVFFGMDYSQEGVATDYNRITAEVSIIKENAGVPVTEKLYQFGKIGGSNQMNVYKLKNSQSTDYMRIQFAANSQNVDFSISTEKGDKKNSTSLSLKSETKRGKVFVTFKTPNDKEYLYLNVFVKKADYLKSVNLNNYVFKYINAAEEKLFFEYNIYKNNPTITNKIVKNNKKNVVSVNFNRIEADNVDITYSLKVLSKKTRLEKENLNTIALIESDSAVVQVDNPPKSSNNTVSLKMTDIDFEISDIQVIAQIFNGIITEYVAYDAVSFASGSKKTKFGNIPAWLIFLVGGVLITVVVVLVLVIFSFKSKNKDLMDQVNKISFQQSMGKEPDTNLLLNEEKNELE